MFISWLGVGLSTGRAGLVLDLTQTQLVGVGWRAEEPGLNPPKKSVESVSSEGEHQSGRVGCRNKESIESWKKSRQNMKNSPDFGNICRILHFFC